MQHRDGEEGLTLVTPSATPAVSLVDAKAYCRVDGSADDDRVSDAVADATDYIQATRDRTLMLSTWKLTLDSFPGWWDGSPSAGMPPHLYRGSATPDHETIRLRRGPLVAVTGIQYVATDGTLTTLDPSLYQVDTTSLSGRIMPAYSTVWPSTRAQVGAVSVTYTAGFATSAAIPGRVKRALKFLTMWFYEHRGDDDATAPAAVDFALSSFGSGRHN